MQKTSTPSIWSSNTFNTSLELGQAFRHCAPIWSECKGRGTLHCTLGEGTQFSQYLSSPRGITKVMANCESKGNLTKMLEGKGTCDGLSMHPRGVKTNTDS